MKLFKKILIYYLQKENKNIKIILEKLLKNEEFYFLDIGAAEGIPKRWKLVENFVNKILIEPHPESAKQLKTEGYDVIDKVLYSKSNIDLKFNHAKKEMCSSFLEPNLKHLDKFLNSKRFHIVEETNFITSAICCLLSHKTKNPIKLRLDRDDDIIITGKRHDFFSDYEVGFDNDGRINGLKIKLASRCGMSPDLSLAINERALLHLDNAYFLKDIEVKNYLCKTNTSSSTAFRGFGGNQGMMAIENILDNISRYLKKDPADVRKLNFYGKKNRNVTHYGMKIKDNVINELFEDLKNKSNYKNRVNKIKQFNKGNKFKKKGIAITPVKFGISFTTIHLNQAGALVHIYTDGSIHMNHGGIEMGQGTHTKIAQLVSNSLGVSYEKVQISATNTSKVPNTSASAASSTTDLNGAATLDAVSKIKSNLNNFIKKKYKIYSKIEPLYKNGNIYFGNRVFNFDQIIKEAYLNRVSLSSSGFYSTPKINFNKKKFKGRPFYYFCYGAAVTEVTIDTLTGESILDRVDILQDAGNAINPALEHGQIEGGFVQGQGWLTMEEVIWGNDGKIKTFSPSTYKIPAVTDIPKIFNVEIFKKGLNVEKVVNKAKTNGEPPLMLAMSVFFAIKDAISSISNYQKVPDLDAPATAEKILLSIKKLKNII